MAASNVVHQLVNILQALDTSITPSVTQFHKIPIARLTHQEYINQELSMFKRIVTINKGFLKPKDINTLRCIMSIGLDYQTATDFINNVLQGNELYDVLLDIRKHQGCPPTSLDCQKAQTNLKIDQKIEELKSATTQDPDAIALLESYIKVNIDLPLTQPTFELPNNGFLGDQAKFSFVKAIKDYVYIKTGGNIPIPTNAVNDETISGKLSNNVYISDVIQDLIPTVSFELSIYYRNYGSYNEEPLYYTYGAAHDYDIRIVADGNHYQLITNYNRYDLKDNTGTPIEGLSIHYPLYYDKDGILTKRENLSTKRKLEIIFNESMYDSILSSTPLLPSNNNMFSQLDLAEKLHILHRFDIDIPINIDRTNIDGYIKDIIT